MTETLSFNLVRKERIVQLVTIEGEKEFTLRELTGADRDSYLTKMSSKMRYVNGVQSGMKDFTGLQAQLIHLSLYDDADERVSLAKIQKFPSSVVTSLFDACQELSSLSGQDEEELGND